MTLEEPASEIKDLIERLDQLVPRDGAWLTSFEYGGGPDESGLRGNRAGFQRLGLEILAGSVAPKIPKSEQLPIDFTYLFDDQSFIMFDRFELDERERSASPESKPRIFSDKVLLVGCAFVLISVLALCIIGFSTVAGWLH